MITIEKALELEMTYPLERFGPLETLLFFDIETTGFSGDYSNLYLIGCTYWKDGCWNLIQWFADRADAEEEILHSFFSFLKRYTTLIHFNGDGFDIPYLLKRCRAFGLTYDFNKIKSVDIYRLIKPYKKLLGLESLKQKSIEGFLGVCREDTYSGGQLIEIYHSYLQNQREALYRLLLLHNEDDLKGMPSIVPILFYPDFIEGHFTFESQEVLTKQDIFGTLEQELVLTYRGECHLPTPLGAECSDFSLELYEDKLTLTVPLFTGELKRFYPDYQNYYYLIYEDNAIHKSVGEYVEKNARKKATAKTCYTRVNGTFLPQTASVWSTVLKSDYKDKISFVPYEQTLFEDLKNAAAYLEGILKTFR